MSYENNKKKIRKLVSEHFEKDIPERIRRLSNIASYDLYFGPFPPDKEFEGDFDWPGFEKAIDEIKPWIESNIPSDLWVDIDCDYIMEKEPDGYLDDETGEYIEPFLEYYHLDSFKEIASYIFNKELINTIF